jgi:hypothetical protein
MNMCVLSLDVINDIISNNGFESMHLTDKIQNLSLLFDMCVNSQFPINIFKKKLWLIFLKIPKNKTFYEQLITWYYGL